MAKSIPMIITNDYLLVYDRQNDDYKSFAPTTISVQPNIPFYHSYAKDIAETQHLFKTFIKEIYSNRPSKNILAIVVPDDTTPLESIFINEFFVNSGACKGVAQIEMGQTLSKEYEAYISISKSTRNVVMQYIKNNEVVVARYYDSNDYNVERIMDESGKLHIDVEYNKIPIFVNNFNLNMDDFFEMGEIITPRAFMSKISNIDVEKI